MRSTISLQWLLATALPCLASPTTPAGSALSPADRRNPRRLMKHNVSNLRREAVFEHRATDATMSYVANSGICETTPGVNTYSGYLSVGTNMNMFFWFFEARANATQAPLAMWLNGGPGCSSMIGLFQEHGPCHFPAGSSSSEPTLNPYSWNEYANMLYVDQPIGTGFSYGNDGASSTVTAAPYVWKLLQAFYAAFPTYESRDFGLWTESYGGHYGPEFAAYFEEQNAKIESGEVTGEKINLIALGINNGWIHPATQYGAYAEYALLNNHRQLINEQQYLTYKATFNKTCPPAMAKCSGLTGNDSACLRATDVCSYAIEAPIEDAFDFNVYDIRQPSNDTNPPETYVDYLNTAAVQSAIGAKQTYSECPDQPFYDIYDSGDDARSFLGRLSTVVQSGINVLIWAGDADWICNWMGNLQVADMIDYPESSQFQSAAVAPYTVDGKAYGEFKSAANLHWLRVYDAGHEVPYYQPEVSLQAFKQIMQKQPLTST